MTMEENDTEEFAQICKEFVVSSKNLLEAAKLCADDPVKQEMISFIIPDFNSMMARSEGIKILLYSDDFFENKQFILEEMKLVASQSNEIARKIRNKLLCLN